MVVREDGVECVVVWRLETKGWEPQMNTDEHEWGGKFWVQGPTRGEDRGGTGPVNGGNSSLAFKPRQKESGLHSGQTDPLRRPPQIELRRTGRREITDAALTRGEGTVYS